MKENEKKSSVRVTEGNQEQSIDIQDGKEDKLPKLKKPLIFGLMGIVFIGSMYLLFKPSADKKSATNVGLIEAVPQATESKLPDDKGKAYDGFIENQSGGWMIQSTKIFCDVLYVVHFSIVL